MYPMVQYALRAARSAAEQFVRIRVSKATQIDGVRLAMGLPESWLRSRHLPTYLTLAQQLGPRIDTLTASGCPLLDIAELAAGRVDAAFVLGLEEQDSLVGTLLLKEAGALMGGPDGSPGVTPEGRLMAAGPRLYKSLVQTLQPHL